MRLWPLNTISKDDAKRVYEYISNSGQENYNRVLDYILNLLCDIQAEIEPFIDMPWQGLVDPNDSSVVYSDLDSYKRGHGWDDRKPSAMITVSREAWVSGNCQMRTFMFNCLERSGFNAVMLMCKPKDDPAIGAKGFATSFYEMLTDDGRPLIDTFIVNSYMQDDIIKSHGKQILLSKAIEEMDVPVFCPMEIRTMGMEQWVESQGIGQLEASRISIPEMMGYIEPIPMAVKTGDTTISDYLPIEERCQRIADRMYRRAMLRKKPNSEKKIVIMLNIGPCSTLEATLGLAHHLDSMESAVRILRRLKDEGYVVEVPESGETLRDMIVSRHAYPEFRWTSVEDTVKNGGVLYSLDSTEYIRMFETLDPTVREEVIKVWGEPPGEGMLHDEQIIIPGIRLGNAVVMLQPKRGCVGRECSGKYCKILTDPYCPPNHHYLATYLYLDRIMEADVHLGMGSHGTLEHLPGKRNGLSSRCYPDICIGTMPNLYIFDACDLAHASIAKRRGYATMFGHMPAVSKRVGLSEEQRKLMDVVGSYNALSDDPAYEEEFRKNLKEALDSSGMILNDIPGEPLEKTLARIRRQLDGIVSSFIETDGHVYGDLPDREMEIRMVGEYETYDHPEIDYDDILSIARYALDGKQLDEVLKGYDEDLGGSVRSVYNDAKEFISRVRESREMDSLIRGLGGGFTTPGPAGNLLRGKSDIYPTGRNLYGMNPSLLPTKTSYSIGCDLADELLKTYMDENGSYPEEVALSWMSNDLAIADGELIGEIMSLIGVEPEWSSDGKMNSFTIIPEINLKHPRIDVLIRPAATVLSVFKDRIDMVDRMITAVAVLNEPPEINYVHAHTMNSVDSGATEIEATSRIFAIGPGQSSGLYYAVMASAWETDADLAGIFLANNGYAYGVNKDGLKMHAQFGYQLSKVSATFNKIVSDDKDLLLSGGFFTSQGGIAMTSEYLTGKKVRSYYGDTRSSKRTCVRTLSDEIDRLTAAKVLNPEWIRANMDAGYSGATAMMGAVQKLYGWQITSKDVDDRVFDGIVREYVENEEVREFLKSKNPFALEDLERRMLELETRGLWTTDEETLKQLKDDYLEIEGDLEGFTDDPDCQRGEITVTRMSDEYSVGKEVIEVNRVVSERLSK